MICTRAESAMHAQLESRAGFVIALVHEIDPSHTRQLCEQGCNLYSRSSALENNREATLGDCDCSSSLIKNLCEKQNKCRTANVVLQNHDVCPLGFPMFFLQQSVSCSHLTGPCLYLASCRSHCSARLAVRSRSRVSSVRDAEPKSIENVHDILSRP